MEENADAASVDVEDNSSFLNDEIEALQSIYINETEVEKDVNSTIVSIDLHPATADNLNEQYVKMTLKLNLLEGYPEVIPEINFRNPRGLSDEKLNCIMQDLIKVAESKKGNSMLFEIIESAKDHLTAENRPSEECAICLYGFEDDDVFTKTECYHYFHSHCLARYARNDPENESKCEENDEESKDTELLCPVCRLPIHFEGSETSYPAPVREDEEFVVPNDLIEMQKKMSELYLRQVEKGGIIDIEAEKNKYLLEISQVPSASDDTRLEDNESHSNMTQVSKDSGETLPQESNEVSKNKTENSLGTVAKSTVNDAAIQENQRNVKHDGRTKRYNDSGRGRNKFYNGGYGGNRKSDKYKDIRENDDYAEEERYDNSRRNDRYTGERISNRYNNDRGTGQYFGDRRNDRYYGDRRNDRYNSDRRNNRYSDDRRNGRYNGDKRTNRYDGDNRNDRYYGDKRNDHYSGNSRNGRFSSDRNDQHGSHRRNDHYDNRGKNGDLDEEQKNNKSNVNIEDQECDASRKCEDNNKTDQYDEDTDRKNDMCDDKKDDHSDDDRKSDRYVNKRNHQYGGYRRNGSRYNDREFDDSEKSECNNKTDQHDEDSERKNETCNDIKGDQSDDDRKNERYANKRNHKYGGYRRNDRYNGPRWNDRYDNDRRNFRYEGSERKNYKKNSGFNESRRNENSIRKDTKSEENKSSTLSEVNHQELSQSKEVENAIEHEKSVCIENAENIDFISNHQNFPNDRQGTKVSSQSLNYKNKADRNRGTNRQTDENNYGRQNYRKDSDNKRYNVSRNYNRDYSGSTQGKHSKSQSNQIAEDRSLNHKAIDKNGASELANERAAGKSNIRHTNSHETKTGSKNDECDDGEANYSNRKTSQKFNTSYNDQGMHPRRNSFKNYHEGRSERDGRNHNRNHSYKDSQLSKFHLSSDSNHFIASNNSSATVNDSKNGKGPSMKSGNENGHYRNDAENVNDKCKETNVPEAISSEKLSNGSTILAASETTKELENPVPSSNFLPPMSSIAPPPGFLNPSRKVVYGLAAANPPPGFHRS